MRSLVWQKIKGEDNINLKLVLVVAATGLILHLGKLYQGNIYVQGMFDRIDSLGVWAPTIYVISYILISGILLPSVVFKVFAGTLFGITGGVVWASVASAISSLIKFYLARYFFRSTIKKKINRSSKLRILDNIIETDGWKMLLLLRNVPVASSMFLNYICGVSNMKARDFVTASFIGRLPTTLLYVYLGFLVGYSTGIEEAKVNFEWIFLWIGLLACVGLTYYTIYISRKLYLAQEETSETLS